MMRVSKRWTVFGVTAAVLVGAAACSEPPPPPPPAAPTVASPEARAQFYQGCWAHYNNKAWDQFQNCYAETAVSEAVDSTTPADNGRAAIVEHDKALAESFPDRRGEPRLILINGERIATIALYTATNTGPMPGPDGKPMPATGKSVGLLIGHTLEMDATGSVAVRDASYLDEGTMMAQLGLNPAPAPPAEKATGAPPTVVLATNDATETANLAEARKIFDAVNAHDVAALTAATPDNYKAFEPSSPTPKDKKASLQGMQEMFGAFPDVRITPTRMWAAGDYVAIEGTFEGTNTGPMPSMGMKKGTGNKVSVRFLEFMKFENGQCTEDWLFYNGAAWAAQLGLK